MWYSTFGGNKLGSLVLHAVSCGMNQKCNVALLFGVLRVQHMGALRSKIVHRKSQIGRSLT